jgi:metal-sulfur cluster biosynthetic enzyme
MKVQSAKLKAEIQKQLENVLDPELHVSIVDLGLVYDIQERNGQVRIKMTLTSIGCPLSDLIKKVVKEKLSKIKGVKGVEVELIFDPPWTKERLSQKAKLKLGI